MKPARLVVVAVGMGIYCLLFLVDSLRASAIRSFYIAIPIFAAILLAPSGKMLPKGFERGPRTLPASKSNLLFVLLLVIFMFLQALMILLLRTDGTRGERYYIVLFASLLALASQLFIMDDLRASLRIAVLTEMGVSLCSIVLSKTIAYGHYFGVMDSIFGSHYVDLVVSSGRIQPQMGNYFLFPVEFVEASTVRFCVGDVSSLASLSILFGVAAFASPYLVSIVLKNLGLQRRTFLIGSFIISHGALTIFFFSELMPQGLLFYFSLPIFVCVMRRNRVKEFTICFLLFAVLTTLTHPMVPIVVLATAVALMMWDTSRLKTAAKPSPLQLIMVYATLTASYLAIVSMRFYKSLAFRPLPGENVSVVGAASSIEIPDVSSLLVSAFRNAGISFEIFFLIFLAAGILQGSLLRKQANRLLILSILGGATILYFPSPISLLVILNSYFVLWRVALFMEPLVLLGVSLGLSQHSIGKRNVKSVVIVFVLALIVFSSTTSSRNDSDDPWIGPKEFKPLTYFTDSDLALMGYIKLVDANESILSDAPFSFALLTEGINGQSFLVENNDTLRIDWYRIVIVRNDQVSDRGVIASLPNSQGSSSAATPVVILGFNLVRDGSQVVVDNGQSYCAIALNDYWIPLVRDPT